LVIPGPATVKPQRRHRFETRAHCDPRVFHYLTTGNPLSEERRDEIALAVRRAIGRPGDASGGVFSGA
jgi:hypothetical protein